VGLGIKRMARDLAAQVFNLVVFPEYERHTWHESSYFKRLLSILEIDCIFDVGANRGQFGRWLRVNGFSGEIISFEPNPAAFAELQVAASVDEKWICYPWALGSENGQMCLNVMRSDDFSSFLNPRADVDFAHANKIASMVEVPIKTLEDVYKPSKRPFLKMDTQGYDLQVLKGAANVLPEFCGLLSEVSFVQIYDGAPTFSESMSSIREAGFLPSALFSVHPAETLKLVEMNAYFVREDLIELDPAIRMR
jgi:FkbM family methyltransferase